LKVEVSGFRVDGLGFPISTDNRKGYPPGKLLHEYTHAKINTHTHTHTQHTHTPCVCVLCAFVGVCLSVCMSRCMCVCMSVSLARGRVGKHTKNKSLPLKSQHTDTDTDTHACARTRKHTQKNIHSQTYTRTWRFDGGDSGSRSSRSSILEEVVAQGVAARAHGRRPRLPATSNQK